MMNTANLGVTAPGLYTEATEKWFVRSEEQVGYEIRLRDGVFRPSCTDLVEGGTDVDGGIRRFVVMDSNVDRLHGATVRSYFDQHGVEYSIMVVEANETLKEFDTVSRIVKEIDAFGIARRREPLIVIGGGVLMDIVGLVASLYRRGTPFLRVPTTLIGLVDAGVGVKTGINFNGHKNRLGTYAPADLTLLDRRFLSTLDRRHIGNGMAEILKIALIKDRALFGLLERYGPTLLDEKFQGMTAAGDQAAKSVLRTAIHAMLEELQPNLRENRLERCVDYGHTFSPTLEMRALPELLHGEAVCVDMAFTTIIARTRGLLSEDECDRILAVMSALELPSWHSILAPGLLAQALQDIVRHRDGLQRLPLPVGIGDVTFVNDVTVEEIESALILQQKRGVERIPSRAA